MVTKVNVQEAKTHLSRLLSQVERGDEFVISRAGVPVARLSGVAGPPARELGFVTAPIPDDFDDALPADELAAWS